MKLRHPLLLKGVGLGLSWLLRRWTGTLGVRFRSLGSVDVEPRHDNTAFRFIITPWHEDVPFLTGYYGGPQMCALISEHADGRLITEACRHLRMRTVAGSSTRGGMRAVRQMLREKRATQLAVTPDGPHGPRREVKAGVIYIASRTGLPLVPIRVAYRKAWRLRTWDRMVLPCPGSEVLGLGSEPIHVPADADRDTLEEYRIRLQQAMESLDEVAEAFLATPSLPVRPPVMAGGVV